MAQAHERRTAAENNTNGWVEWVRATIKTETDALREKLTSDIMCVIDNTCKAVDMIVGREEERERDIRDLQQIAFYVDTNGDLNIVKSGVKEKIGHVIGPKGDPGPAGADSTVAGPPGIQGERGIQGPPGTLPAVRKWGPNTVYYMNDVVTHGGSTYQCVADNEQREPGSDEAWTCWTCLAAAGTHAKQLNFRGAYKSDDIYDAYDVAVVGGSSFVARRNRAGICPGEDWVLMSGVGRKGLAGQRGPRGEQGDRGADGAPAPNPMITGWRIVRDQYAVVPLGPDGEVIGAPLYLRELFEQFVSEKGAAT
jgi:hypothetical protein